MKKQKLFTLLLLLFFSAAALAQETSVTTESDWPDPLRSSTRNLIQTGMSQEDAQQMTRSMLQAGFTQQNILSLQHMVHAAHQQGIPADMVAAKIHEGIAKNVPPEGIEAAMERLAARYQVGNMLAARLEPEKQQQARFRETLVTGMAAGLLEDDADKLIKHLEIRTQHMEKEQLRNMAEECLLTVRNMVRQGVSSETATDVVSKAVERGYSSDDIRTMRNSFTRQGAAMQAETLAKGYRAGIEQGKHAENLGEGALGGPGSGYGSHGEPGSGGSDGSGGNGGSDGGNGGGGDSGGGNGGSDGGNGGGGDSGGGNGGSDGGNGGGGDSGGGNGGSGGSGGGR